MNLREAKMTRVFLVEPLIDQRNTELLARHGELLPLTTVAIRPMPAVWNTMAMSQWIRECLSILHTQGRGFDYSKDYLALVGNALSLAQLTATLIVEQVPPYKIRCLSYSRKNSPGEYAHVLLEEAEWDEVRNELTQTTN